MKTGPRYIGEVNYNSIVAHIEKMFITNDYRIKMNPLDFQKLIIEYEGLFHTDFNALCCIKGISVESFQATPVNRICVVGNNSESCTI